MIINIIGDTHDTPQLIKLLSTFDNLISLGDISAVDTKEYLSDPKLYSRVWKAYTHNDFSTTSKEEKEWFDRLNTTGFKKQIQNIVSSNKDITVIQGNTDLMMLNTYPELSSFLTNNTSSKFKYIMKPEIKVVDSTQMIFLPFNKGSFVSDLEKVGIDASMHLVVLGHCPIYKEHKRSYYVEYFTALKALAAKYWHPFTYIHGHVHADNSYVYSLPEIPNLTIHTPKAEDSDIGMGSNHHVVQLDTSTGSLQFWDSVESRITKEVELSESEYLKSDHWNRYDKKNI